MGWKGVLVFLFVVLALGLLFFYEFSPLVQDSFQIKQPKETNFSLNNLDGNASVKQFYLNMRFPDKMISYKISDNCNLEKKAETEEAVRIIGEETVLSFYPVERNEEIFIGCSERTKKDETGLFVAGEGGPTKIIQTERYAVVFEGEILLIRNSECERPNVAIHEIFHVLGFEHSENEGNIMYPVSKCNQVIGEDLIQKINSLYAQEILSDLTISDATGFVHGRYVDLNLTINNDGLKKSASSKLIIYANDKILQETDFDPLEIGYGKILTYTNIFSSERKISEIKIVVESSENELSKENNQILLVVGNS